jgi:hypothetical protein
MDDGSRERPGAARFRRYLHLDAGIATCRALTHRARMVLLALMGFVDQEGVCWPSLARLAAETAYHVRSVKRALAELRGAGIVVRETRGVFRVDLEKVAGLAGASVVPSGDNRVTGKGTTLSPGRGQACHTELLTRNSHPQNTPSLPPEALPDEAPGAVCVVGSERSRERAAAWVAEAFPLPRGAGGALVVPRELGKAIGAAVALYGPRDVRRAVELMAAEPWRKAELGAWVFESEAFGAKVAQAQQERRRRRPTVRSIAPVVEVPVYDRPSAEQLGSWRRAIGG